MLSRVANIIYWTARYLERAENTARIVEVNAQLVLDLQSRQSADDPRAWEPLVFVTGNDDLFHKQYGKEPTERAVVEFMLFDRSNPSSVFSCIATARENARCIRDQLTGEVWEMLNSFYLRLKEDDFDCYTKIGAAEYLTSIKEQIQLFYGVIDSMLPRSDLWWFFELGRYLERADNVSRILDVKYFMLLPNVDAVGSALDMIQWASVLRSCSAFEAFRRARRGQLKLDRVVDYLLRDLCFPRSIGFSVAQAEFALMKITAGMQGALVDRLLRLVKALRKEIDETDVKAAIANGLHEYLDHLQKRVSDIHAAVQSAFIEYPTAKAG